MHSVDLVAAGVAWHWLDQDRIWPAMDKVVKPGGTVAFWGYNLARISGHPEVLPIFRDFIRSPELHSYWQYGVDKIFAKYRDLALPKPEDGTWDASSSKRIFFEGPEEDEEGLTYYPLPKDNDSATFPEEKEYRTDTIMTKHMTWNDLEEHVRSWSGVVKYFEEHPEDKARRGGGKIGDLVEKFIASLKEKLPAFEEGMDVYFPLFLVLIKKSA